MTQDASDQSHCKICKTLVSQDIIKLRSWFCTCGYTFLDPTKTDLAILLLSHQENTDFQMTIIMLLMVIRMIIMMIIVIIMAIMLITIMEMMLILW